MGLFNVLFDIIHVRIKEKSLIKNRIYNILYIGLLRIKISIYSNKNKNIQYSADEITNKVAANPLKISFNGWQSGEIFYYINMAVDIYDIIQYHQRNKHLREILITKFDKYNEFISKKGNKNCLPSSAHERLMILKQLSLLSNRH